MFSSLICIKHYLKWLLNIVKLLKLIYVAFERNIVLLLCKILIFYISKSIYNLVLYKKNVNVKYYTLNNIINN